MQNVKKTHGHKTAQEVFNEAFPPGRAPRSEAYKRGVLDCLRFRIDDVPEVKCPYDQGTAEADAYLAGVDEGIDLSPLGHEPEAGLREVYAYLNDLERQVEITLGLPPLTTGPCIFLLWDGMLCEGVLHREGEQLMLTHYNLSTPDRPEKITHRADTGKVQGYAQLTGHHRAVT